MLRNCRHGIRKLDRCQRRAVFEGISAKSGQIFAECNRFQIGTAVESKVSDRGKHGRFGKVQRLQIGTAVECRSADGPQHGRDGNTEQRFALIKGIRLNGLQPWVQADGLQCRAFIESCRADVGTFAQILQRSQCPALEKCIVRNTDHTVLQLRRAEFGVLRETNDPVSGINDIVLRLSPQHRLHESIRADAFDRLRNDAVAVQRVIVQRGATVKCVCTDFLKRPVQQQHVKPGTVGERAFLKHLQIFAGFKANQRFDARKGILSDNPNGIRQLHRLQNRCLIEAVVNDSDRPLL